MAKRKIDRVDFLSDHVMALKQVMEVDIIVKPGDNGPGIPSHRAVLALKSKVFRNMLDCDECKASPEKSITIPDMSYGQVESLLDFFYSGTLSPHNKHVRALYLAADKYDIQYLQDSCRQVLISSLSVNNVFSILELSLIPADDILKEAAIDFIARNSLGVIFSKGYESLVLKNPPLSLEITRACLNILKPYIKLHQNRHLHHQPYLLPLIAHQVPPPPPPRR